MKQILPLKSTLVIIFLIIVYNSKETPETKVIKLATSWSCSLFFEF